MSENLKSPPQNAQQARDLGASHYYTGKPCKNGHLSERRVSDNKCLECDKNFARKKRADPKAAQIIRAQRKARWDLNKDKESEKRRSRYARNPAYREKIQSQVMRRKFGFGIECYDEILKIHKGSCAICKTIDTGSARNKRFAIDHDHKSGRVRGLLCKQCNTLLGNARDEVETLKSAITYLNYHKALQRET